VGELKKEKYVYYHCTGNRGKCPEPYTREENLTKTFATILKELVIPQPILDWLSDTVLESDRTEQATRVQGIKRLQARYEQIGGQIEMMYTDKLEGRITQEFFDKRAKLMQGEQGQLLRKIQDVQKATPTPIDQAIDMLCLTTGPARCFCSNPARSDGDYSSWLSKRRLGGMGVADNPVRTV
jgi:site-specific DNA recombinase